MNIKTFYCNPYRECTYIVDWGGSDCIIIDPGMCDDRELQRVIDYLTTHQLTPQAVLITHAHPDHICGLENLQIHFPNLPIIDYQTQSLPPLDGGLKWVSIPTPGHKEDCVCYYFEADKVLFSGDTLFQESIGRTDLPGGDMATLMRSLETLKQLPDDTAVYPGHGYPTTIAHEKQYNPYF